MKKSIQDRLNAVIKTRKVPQVALDNLNRLMKNTNVELESVARWNRDRLKTLLAKCEVLPLKDVDPVVAKLGKTARKKAAGKWLDPSKKKAAKANDSRKLRNEIMNKR